MLQKAGQEWRLYRRRGPKRRNTGGRFHNYGTIDRTVIRVYDPKVLLQLHWPSQKLFLHHCYVRWYQLLQPQVTLCGL